MVFLCVLINIYGVRFATMVNNIGVGLELVVTVLATAFVAIIAFSAPDHHQPISVLFTGGTSEGHGSYMLAWLAAGLGPFFGLIGVESGADVAEETKNARYVVPKTMMYALVTSVVIELLMYIVYVLAIRDAGAVQANTAAPIDEIINQQAGPVVTKIVVAVALTNILACLLSNILVATRLTYSMARDNILPFSHVWRHVSPARKTPTYAVIGLGCLSTVLLLSALVNAGAFNYIIGIASLLFFLVYILQTIGLLVAVRRGTISLRSPAPSISAALASRCTSSRWWCSSPLPSRCSSCRSSPATSGYSWESLRRRYFGGRPVCGRRLRNGDAGPQFVQTHLSDPTVLEGDRP